MGLSLIRKKQLASDALGIVGEFGSGFFIPISARTGLTFISISGGNAYLSGISGAAIAAAFAYASVAASGYTQQLSGNINANFVRTGVTGSFYPRNNPSGFITQTQANSTFANKNETGAFLTTGNVYTRDNPSGFVTSTELSGYMKKTDTFITGNYSITSIVSLTQAQYNSITPSAQTLYIVI